MLPSEEVPIFNGKGVSCHDYEQQVRLWVRLAKMEPLRRAVALVLHVNSVALQLCLSARGDRFDNTDGATCELEILRNYFAPDAADSVNQGGGSFNAVSSGGPDRRRVYRGV